MENKELTEQERIRLIAGRITDEYRKHPSLDWAQIAAIKLNEQWADYQVQLEEKDKRIRQLEATVEDRENHCNFLEDKRTLLQEGSDLLVSNVNDLEKEVERLKSQVIPAKILKSILEVFKDLKESGNSSEYCHDAIDYLEGNIN